MEIDQSGKIIHHEGIFDADMCCADQNFEENTNDVNQQNDQKVIEIVHREKIQSQEYMHQLLFQRSPIYENHDTFNFDITSHEKDRQRILLESTMSPLLAAVNDITQRRDAELQSFLNQNDSLKTLSNTNTFQLKQSFDDERSEDLSECLVVYDTPIESRARASLPNNYLYFSKNDEIAICAKKEIPIRTQFGPFEGELRFISDTVLNKLRMQSSRKFPLLLIGKSRMLDASNEDTSNWMRFVRMADEFTEQNLQIYEEIGKIYFRCTKKILPEEELRIGYSEEYSKNYNLECLYSNEYKSLEFYEKESPWKYCEYNNDDDDEDDDNNEDNIMMTTTKTRYKMKRIQYNKKSRKFRCLYCHKIYMTSNSLKKHIKIHTKNETNRKKNLIVSCTTNEKPKKVKQNNNRKIIRLRNICIYCSEKFRSVAEFRQHISTHALNDLFYCFMCKKKYLEYSAVRKHIKMFHQSTKYPCSDCGRQFLHISFLRRHKIIHSEKCDFLCSQCGKQFKRKDKMKEHVARVHSEEKKLKLKIKEEKLKEKEKEKQKKIKRKSNNSKKKCTNYEANGSQYLKLIPKKHPKRESPKSIQILEKEHEEYNYTYKCDLCKIGFKRRGMLVNHLVKRHPEIPIHTIHELNLPILKPQTLFFCNYCSKSYKSNAKRKLHIIKYHPGEELPPLARKSTSLDKLNVKLIGNIKIDVHYCQWCYKQYASRTRLQAHFRKDHAPRINYDEELNNENDQQIMNDNNYVNYHNYHVYPCLSPENKLLKLSSAALELSSIEDRKFFDFLNGTSDVCDSETNPNMNDDEQIGESTEFSKVDVNFKVVDDEFSEVFENCFETITCI